MQLGWRELHLYKAVIPICPYDSVAEAGTCYCGWRWRSFLFSDTTPGVWGSSASICLCKDGSLGSLVGFCLQGGFVFPVVFGVEWSLSEVFCLLGCALSIPLVWKSKFSLKFFGLLWLFFPGCYLLEHWIWDEPKRKPKEHTAMSFFGSWSPVWLFSAFQNLFMIVLYIMLRAFSCICRKNGKT